MTETVAEELPLIQEPVPLTAHDRCDRCIAQAQVRVTFLTGGELILCFHHWKTYKAALAPLAAAIDMEAEKL